MLILGLLSECAQTIELEPNRPTAFEPALPPGVYWNPPTRSQVPATGGAGATGDFDQLATSGPGNRRVGYRCDQAGRKQAAIAD